MNGKKMKVALLGCGKMGMHHLQAIKLQKFAEVVAIADPKADKNKINAITQHDVKFFSDPEDLFFNVKPDVVHIITPPATHTDLALLALNHGANIYVEKPFTLTKEDGERIFSLAKEKNLKVCAGHQLLFEASVSNARDELKNIGDIVHVESYFSFKTVRKSITPVNQLIDILPHPTYLLLNFLQSTMYIQQSVTAEIHSLDVKSSGEVKAIVKIGDISGVLVVTLSGRPIESYVKIVGTNGSLFIDLVRGTVTKLIGPCNNAVSVILNPYFQARQILWNTTISFAKLFLKKQKSYHGLADLIEEFYLSVLDGKASPLTPGLIIDTVDVCEKVIKKLRETEFEAEIEAKRVLLKAEKKLSPVEDSKGVVLVTGGTGFLGSAVVTKLREKGWQVRVIARQQPLYSSSIPGIEYVVGDIAEEVPDTFFKDVEVVVHCAAETMGGKEEHERNTIQTTKNMLTTAARCSVTKFINISSIAVMKTSREMGRTLDETVPLDLNLSRGPYVWGKAKAENLAIKLGKELGIEVRVIRPGPLVDFKSFKAPGRLGKELGPIFVAVGRKRSALSLCDVHTAAEVIRYYMDNFDSAPPLLNLVESTPPSRGELVDRLRHNRPDLMFFWLPMFVLKVMSPPLKLLQKILLSGKKPIDIVDAFATENYNAKLSASIIQKARQS